RIHGIEQRRHCFQNLVRHDPHYPQWMVLPHPLLRRQITEHVRLLMIDSAHDSFLPDHAAEFEALSLLPPRAVSYICPDPWRPIRISESSAGSIPAIRAYPFFSSLLGHLQAASVQ